MRKSWTASLQAGLRRIGCSALLLVVAAGGAASLHAQSSNAQGRWQPPPPPASWNAEEHHGYADGVDAAWLDLADKLPPKPSRHITYQHPPNVKPGHEYSYRLGFRKGYAAVYRHEREQHHQPGQS